MTPYDLPYPSLFFLCGLLSTALPVVTLGRVQLYRRRVQLPFSVFSLATGLWATAYGLQLASSSLQRKLFWNRFVWLGAATAATAWFVFVLAYTGRDELLTRRGLALLTVEPGLAVALAFTGRASDAFIASRELQSVVGHLALVSEFGPLYPFHLLYTGALGFAGVVLLVRVFNRSRQLYRQQVSLILVATGVPGAAFLATLGGLGPAPALDLTPLSFGITSVVFFVALFRYRLFDVTPVARDVVFSEMRDGVVVVDDRGCVVEANRPAQTMFETDTITGTPLDQVGPRPDALVALASGRRERVELTVDTDRGRRFYEATATPFDRSKRHERGTLLVFRDVTERRRTEDQFRALIENSRDLISVVDTTGERRYTSPSVEHVLGYDPDELRGENVLDLVHPDDLPEVREKLAAVVDSDEPIRHEFRLRDADGAWRWFESVGVSLVDDPAVGGIVINSREVTDRHRYRQRLRVLNRVLRHDLRNDMNVILGHADLLLDADCPERREESARTIRRTAQALVDLGEQTRKISHTLERDRSEHRPVEITASIRSELDAIRRANPTAIVHSNLPDELWVSADDLLETALTNVIVNAIEHNDRLLAQVSVTAATVYRDGQPRVAITVRDNGPGIPESERRALSNGTETPLEHASGLGLWLVKWIVENSHGRLTFDENTPRGTVVTIELRPAPPEATS